MLEKSPKISSSFETIVRESVLKRLDSSAIVRLPPQELSQRIDQLVSQIANERGLPLNKRDQSAITLAIVDDILGLGPIEPLLKDPDINDILINGPDQVYVERQGLLEQTSVRFRDKEHVFHIAQRIAAGVGRRIDEANPMLDARLADGSRVNIVLPPLASTGPYVSIRKFSRDVTSLAELVKRGTMSSAMADVLAIMAACRLNIVVSGGTGAGKTTLLNAMSMHIAPGERVVTIEDVLELQLRQPHVLPLETRQANMEGRGAVVSRDLVRNALRMRPDRIIIGEVRGSEAFDMMQAMNTGHDGSMTSVHANSARDALHRIENMILMAETNLPVQAIRSQVASAVDAIIQVERMRDGVRRIRSINQVQIDELGGPEVAPLWSFELVTQNEDAISGRYVATQRDLRFHDRLKYFGKLSQFETAMAAEAL